MVAALSVPEHCLSFYFVCDDQIQISCAMWLRNMEYLSMTFCYLWLTEKLWLLGAQPPPPEPPFKTLITKYYQSLPHNSTRSWVLVSTLIGDLLIDGLDCLTVKYLAGIKGCSSKTRFISSIQYLGCYALYYGIMSVSILYTLDIQIVC